MKYFTIPRIQTAVTHLQQYDSNWVLVPLVLYANGVNLQAEVSLTSRNGTDKFLRKYFSGELIGLKPFENGNNSMRPRFADIYGGMKNLGNGDDFIYHQRAGLWANVYSSRGYRDMKGSGFVKGDNGKFQLTNSFQAAFEGGLPDTFRFEELLVWLYAFTGVPEEIWNWDELIQYFKTTVVGAQTPVAPEFGGRFRVTATELPPGDFQAAKPTNEEYQHQLYPSLFRRAANPTSYIHNRIIYGAPGVGKSFHVRKEMEELAATKLYVTTFHPEYSYGDFVGAFRPATEDEEITYRFHPEIFIKAYVDAWNSKDDRIVLLIEEINRGNPSAIFGDLFQLLDRDADGYSEYSIQAKDEVATYLKEHLNNAAYIGQIESVYSLKFGKPVQDPFSVMILPSNLVIRATMNTSDQSLFPMDSAFKRRWHWTYMPIQYTATERVLEVDGKKYSWVKLLRAINELTFELTGVEDKCLGQYFVTSDTISVADFRDKVLFYLCSDVLKEESIEAKLRILPKKFAADGSLLEIPVGYNDFFDEKDGAKYLVGVMQSLGIPAVA